MVFSRSRSHVSRFVALTLAPGFSPVAVGWRGRAVLTASRCRGRETVETVTRISRFFHLAEAKVLMRAGQALSH
jgi:hypothetical protein